MADGRGHGHADDRPSRAVPVRGQASDTVGRLCQTILEALRARRVSVWLLDPEGRHLAPYRTAGRPVPEPALASWAGVALEDFPLAAEALRASRALAVEDAAASALLPPRFAAELGVGSAYCEPLVADEPVGLLIVEPAAAADPAELASVRPLVAASAAQARAWHETERRRVQAELLLELTEATAETESLDHALRELCQRLAARLGVRRATVFLADGERLLPAMSAYADGRSDPEAWERFRRATEPPPLVLAAQRTGEPVRAEQGSALLGGWWAESFGVGAAVAVPLVSGARTMGVLVLDSPLLRALSDDELRLSVAAASHASRIIELAQATDERNLQLRVTTAVAKLLERGTAARSAAEAAALLGRVAAEALRLERAVVWLADTAGLITHVLVWPPGSEPAAWPGVGARLGDLALSAVLTEGEPLLAEGSEAAAALGPGWGDPPLPAALVAFALSTGTGRRGIVACTAGRPLVRLGPRERRVAAQLALEGALVLENAALREAEAARLSELAYRALHDPLTGLANRELLFDRLGQALARATRRLGHVAVLFVDLDRFKAVNDTGGHELGDELLMAVAGRLRSSLRPEDTVARFAGDEFAVVLEDVASADDALAAAQRVVERLSRPFELPTGAISTSASVGVALSAPGIGPTELLRRADQAMYAAKAAGRGRAVLFRPSHGADDSPESLSDELHLALTKGGLVLHWQPIVELRSGRVLALEALVRWEHRNRGLVLPDRLLPLAAQAGLDRALGWWVLETALERRQAWETAALLGAGPTRALVPVSVNVAAAHFREPGFAARLARLLERHGASGDEVRVEVPEVALAGDPEANAAALSALRRIGVAVHLDAFGTGYSSLAALARYDLAGFKLDRSLVTSIGTEEKGEALVKAAVDLARDLGKDVSAVGVETPEQARALLGFGCEQGQGFLFAAPMDEEGVVPLARGRRLDPPADADSPPPGTPGLDGGSSDTKGARGATGAEARPTRGRARRAKARHDRG